MPKKKRLKAVPVFDAVPWPGGDFELEVDRPLTSDEVQELLPGRWRVERDGEYS